MKKGCENCIHIEVCALCDQMLPVCDSYKEDRNGQWIEQEDGFGGSYYDCSACGESWTIIAGTPSENNMNYCPKCGAKMALEVSDG